MFEIFKSGANILALLENKKRFSPLSDLTSFVDPRFDTKREKRSLGSVTEPRVSSLC